ncbi:MAG TPA: halocarboxylic acid dehydrogenase DehI family protein [Geminicoccaceae bacterium]
MDRQDDIERGMALIPTLDEVMKESADPATLRIYDEIEAALRVPFVNFVFRVLANRPAFFHPAWARLAPIARSRGFEAAAARVRERAALEADVATVDLGPAGGDLERIRAYSRTIHHVVPKLLLSVTAFDLDAAGEGVPDAATGNGTDFADLDAMPPGMVEGAVAIPMVDPAVAEGKVAALFRDIQATHGHPGVATYYRALAQWPELLDGLWQAVRPLVGGPVLQDRRRIVLDLAAEEMRALRAAARAAGLLDGDPPVLPADQKAEIRAILAVFRFRIIPDLVLIVPLMRRLLER